MATWKKVIVSGSQAVLDSLALDTALPVASGGTGAATLTDGGVLLGSGTGAVTALGQATNGQLVIGSTGADPVLATLTGGANITVTNSAGGISIAASGLGSGTVQSVSATGTENGITLTSDGDSVNPTITLGGALAGVTNAQLSNSAVTVGTTAISLGASSTTLAGLTDVSSTKFSGGSSQVISGSGVVADTKITGSFTGSFTGAFVGTTDLPDLVSGNGISGGPYDGSVTKTFSVANDGSTITVGASGIKVADAGITATQLATSVAGDGLAGGAGTALAVQVDDSSIEISSDSLRVKALGITNAMLAGSIANNKLANSNITVGSTSIQLGGSATTIAGLTSLTSTGLNATNIVNTGAVADTKITGSFTGSFVGDGSLLTGIATNLAIAGESGTGTVALASQTLTVTAGEGINTVAGSQTITISGEDATTTNKGIASFATADFAVSSGAVSLAADISVDNDLTVVRDINIGRNAVVSGNLTVAGTASFQNTTNLDVADRFIRMASGSTTVGDGGIIVQQSVAGGEGFGEAFAWDAAVARWSMTGSFDPATEVYTPDSFMATVVEGGSGVNTPAAVIAKFAKKGNSFVGADQSIWIYS